MQNNKLAKMLAIALAGSVIVTSAGFAASAKSTANTASTSTASTASSSISSSLTKMKKALFPKKAKAEKLKEYLKAAVDANVITQAESDKISAYITDNKPADKKGLFSDLVAKGILTQEKADALKAFIKAQVEAARQEKLKTEIGKLVTDKTITQAQADKIIAAVNAADASRKAAFEKAKTMSKADAKAYLDNFRKTEVKPLDALVKDGTITQAQADKVAKAIHQDKGFKGGCPGGGKGLAPADLKTALAPFVTDKTITQDQADKIIAAVNAADAARKAAFDKAKTMSKADAKAYLDNFRKTEVKPLDSLVKDGTITQDQADKIAKVIHEGRGPECRGPEDGGFMGGRRGGKGGCGMEPAD